MERQKEQMERQVNELKKERDDQKEQNKELMDMLKKTNHWQETAQVRRNLNYITILSTYLIHFHYNPVCYDCTVDALIDR